MLNFLNRKLCAVSYGASPSLSQAASARPERLWWERYWIVMDETFDSFLALSAALAAEADAAQPAGTVLVTLAATEGKGQVAGRRAWVMPGGTLRGTLTLGGCADGQLRREAEAVRQSGQSRLVTLELGSGEEYEFGLTCAGRVTAQLTPHSPAHPLWAWLAEQRRARQSLTLITPLGHGAALPWGINETGESSPGAQASETAGQPGSLSGPAIFIADELTTPALTELRPPPPQLLIVGAGPVAAPLSRLARTLGLHVVVSDDQPQRLTPELLPDAHELLGVPLGHDLRLPPLRWGDAAVVISHDYAHELSTLGSILNTPVSYVALVASRRRGQALLKFMEETGSDPQALSRVHTPAGLDLGLGSPAGIALSVLAEAVQVLQQASAQPLRQPYGSPT